MIFHQLSKQIKYTIQWASDDYLIFFATNAVFPEKGETAQTPVFLQ